MIVIIVLISFFWLKSQTVNGDNPQEGTGIKIGDDIGGDPNGERVPSRINPLVSYTKSQIFPEIKPDALYSFIVVEDGKPVIKDNFIAQFIKIVVNGLGTSEGELDFLWNLKSPQELNIRVNWYEVKGDKNNGIPFLLFVEYKITLFKL